MNFKETMNVGYRILLRVTYGNYVVILKSMLDNYFDDDFVLMDLVA